MSTPPAAPDPAAPGPAAPGPAAPGPRRARPWLRRLARGLGALLLLTTLALTLAALTIDRWLFVLLDPARSGPHAPPPAPDYEDAAAWAALPELDDGADVALPELPAVDPREAPADVFYIHPTTWLGDAQNAAIDAPEILAAVERGGTRIQASAFNGCCSVYAPRYRQAHGRAFVVPDALGDAAIELAVGDIFAAFERYLERASERPFILAGHSQGAMLGARLLRERIAGGPLERRLVAAYLIGGPLTREDVGVPVCEAPTQTGCFVGWNTRGPDYDPEGALEFAVAPERRRASVCVNPLSWTTDGAHVPAAEHPGALFFDIPTPRIEPRFHGARCHEGVLLIDELGALERDPLSRALLWIMGPDNYHPIEYQLAYVSLRRNASARVEAWLAAS